MHFLPAAAAQLNFRSLPGWRSMVGLPPRLEKTLFAFVFTFYYDNTFDSLSFPETPQSRQIHK